MFSKYETLFRLKERGTWRCGHIKHQLSCRKVVNTVVGVDKISQRMVLRVKIQRETVSVIYQFIKSSKICIRRKFQFHLQSLKTFHIEWSRRRVRYGGKIFIKSWKTEIRVSSRCTSMIVCTGCSLALTFW